MNWRERWGYRTAPQIPPPAEIPRTTERDFDLVLFGGACPWCGSTGKESLFRHIFSTDLSERWLVQARTWSFLWLKAHPAYFRVRCAGCKTKFRELTK